VWPITFDLGQQHSGLQAHSHIDAFPNKLQPYLDGAMSASMQTKLLFKAAVAVIV
jgi:hypothetical protein